MYVYHLVDIYIYIIIIISVCMEISGVPKVLLVSPEKGKLGFMVLGLLATLTGGYHCGYHSKITVLQVLLLMAEILHHLGCINPCK